VRVDFGVEKENELVTSKLTALLKEKGGLSNSIALDLEEKIKMPLYFTEKFTCDTTESMRDEI
jgi:hypothetical protein